MLTYLKKCLLHFKVDIIENNEFYINLFKCLNAHIICQLLVNTNDSLFNSQFEDQYNCIG